MKRIISISLVVVGLLIISATFYPLYLMYKEKDIQKNLDQKYKITQQDLTKGKIKLNNNVIEIKDTKSGESIRVEVLLNGKELFEPMNVALAEDGGFTKGVWVNVFNIHKNNDSNEENDLIGIVQTEEEGSSWNLYYVNSRGELEVKSSSKEYMSSDYLDTNLIKRSGNSMIGYISNINYASANPFASIFPIAIFIFGIITTVLGLILAIRIKNKPIVRH